MAVPSADKWASKMLERTQAAGSAWEEGVRDSGPIVGPMKAAAGKYQNNVTKALQEKRWERKVGQLSDDSIKAAALAAGGGRFTSGVSSRADKVRASIQRLQPRVAAISAKIAGMPQDTEQQRDARVLANLKEMRALKSS